MPRALVTGVAGQDGSYLAEALLASGWEVHGLVRPGDPGTDVPSGVHVHRGDLAAPAAMKALLRETEPDHVYNLAGVSSVAYSWQHPSETARVTGLAAVDLMDAALELQERTGRQVRFLQASSAEIFGQPHSAPQDEQTPVRPLSPYAAAKAYAHLSARVHRSRGLHCSSLILYNHESPRRPPGFVVRKITRGVASIARGASDPLVLGNLDARRDWGWAPDYVDAMVKAASHAVADDYVIATGTSHSVRDVLAMAFSHIGVSDWERYVVVDPALLRPAEATELTGDAARAREILGWKPTVDLETVVSRMVDTDLHDNGVRPS